MIWAANLLTEGLIANKQSTLKITIVQLCQFQGKERRGISTFQRLAVVSLRPALIADWLVRLPTEIVRKVIQYIGLITCPFLRLASQIIRLQRSISGMIDTRYRRNPVFSGKVRHNAVFKGCWITREMVLGIPAMPNDDKGQPRLSKKDSRLLIVCRPQKRTGISLKISPASFGGSRMAGRCLLPGQRVFDHLGRSIMLSAGATIQQRAKA